MSTTGADEALRSLCARALLRHPHELARLRADPSLLPSAVEEILRYDGPVNPGLPRYALEDIKVGGVTIPRGSFVVLATAAANRDPAHWKAPDTLDIGREFTEPQLTFGHGIHYCLGARLARTEGEIAIGSLLRRHPHPRLAIDESRLRWRDGGAHSHTRCRIAALPQERLSPPYR